MKYYKRFYSIVLIIVFGLLSSLKAQNPTFTEADSTFEAYIDQGWDEVKNVNEKKRDSLEVAYSTEFYYYYLDHKNTKTGKHAFINAIIMWGNTGYDKYLNEALQTLDYDSEIWSNIIGSIGNIYYQSDSLDFENYDKLLNDLKKKLTDPKSKSSVILSLLRSRENEENKDKAIELARQLVEIEASDFFVDQGLGYLHEFKSLNVGQKAPNFNAQTVEGEKISLSNLKGQFVLLDFWATWCGPCLPEIPHLKTLWKRYKDSNFKIVGISLDRKESDLTKFVNQREIKWSQILETEGWDGEITKMYNVVGIPRTYLIDSKGVIIAKDLRGEKMIEEIEKYISE